MLCAVSLVVAANSKCFLVCIAFAVYCVIIFCVEPWIYLQVYSCCLLALNNFETTLKSFIEMLQTEILVWKLFLVKFTLSEVHVLTKLVTISHKLGELFESFVYWNRIFVILELFIVSTTVWKLNESNRHIEVYYILTLSLSTYHLTLNLILVHKACCSQFPFGNL